MTGNIDDEALNSCMDVDTGGLAQEIEVVGSGDLDTHFKAERNRLAELEAVLHDIAVMADGHKGSTLYIAAENVALVNIRNMAAIAIGLDDILRETGTLLVKAPTVTD